jgi:hypothetical protein
MTSDRPELADAELTAQLAEALRGDWGDERYEIALSLLPVVRRYGDRRAAEELEAAANDLHLNISGRDQLRDCAAALRGEADHDE